MLVNIGLPLYSAEGGHIVHCIVKGSGFGI